MVKVTHQFYLRFRKHGLHENVIHWHICIVISYCIKNIPNCILKSLDRWGTIQLVISARFKSRHLWWYEGALEPVEQAACTLYCTAMSNSIAMSKNSMKTNIFIVSKILNQFQAPIMKYWWKYSMLMKLRSSSKGFTIFEALLQTYWEEFTEAHRSLEKLFR